MHRIMPRAAEKRRFAPLSQHGCRMSDRRSIAKDPGRTEGSDWIVDVNVADDQPQPEAAGRAAHMT